MINGRKFFIGLLLASMIGCQTGPKPGLTIRDSNNVSITQTTTDSSSKEMTTHVSPQTALKIQNSYSNVAESLKPGYHEEAVYIAANDVLIQQNSYRIQFLSLPSQRRGQVATIDKKCRM